MASTAQQRREENGTGFRCEKCGCLTGVTDSRPAHGMIRRRRKCLSPTCGERFTTYEVSADNFAAVAKLMDLKPELGLAVSRLDQTRLSLQGLLNAIEIMSTFEEETSR